MSNLTQVLNFEARHGGPDAATRLLEMLNAGFSLNQIADKFGMHHGQFSVFLKTNFRKVYVLNEDVQDAKDGIEQSRRERYEATRRNAARVISLAVHRAPHKKEIGG